LNQPSTDFLIEAKFYLSETNYDLMKSLIAFEEDLKFEQDALAQEKRSKKNKKKSKLF